jgi:hypothetical protein
MPLFAANRVQTNAEWAQILADNTATAVQNAAPLLLTARAQHMAHMGELRRTQPLSTQQKIAVSYN